ncbi:MAG TPA: nuclear transport factor 2 family protein [Candidatus Limnocylindria bacterium]
MSTDRLRALAEQLATTQRSGDLDAYVELLAPDYAVEFPQSREVVRGPANVRRMLAEHPQAPRFDGAPRVTLLGERWAAVETHSVYGDEPWWVVSVVELGERLARRERSYYAPRLGPATWRAPWVVPLAEGPAPGPAAGQSVERDVVERYFRAQSEADLDTLTRLRHPAWVHDMPQAGERFPSSQAYVEAHAHYPGGLPALTPLALVGAEDQWVIGASPVPLRVNGIGAHWLGEVERVYPSGETWFDLLFMDFQDGQVVAERSYWCQPFDAPAWRSDINERY